MTPEELLAPQPPTKPGEDRRSVFQLVLADIDAGRYPADAAMARVRELVVGREEFGIRKYGVPLPVDSNRDSRIDELQEALDGMAYSRQTYEQAQNRKKATANVDWGEFGRHCVRADRAWARHLRCLQTVVELLEELGAQSPPAPRKVCTDPDKMHGSCDGFGGSDYDL